MWVTYSKGTIKMKLDRGVCTSGMWVTYSN